jgi:hypothetical protein
MARLDPLRTRASSVGGGLLATATRSVAAVRSARKPLHPRGVVVPGRIHRTGLAEPTGSPWLDEPGEDEVVVRLSRAVGLPTRLPDIHGLAIRVLVGETYGDLLFASTGWGRLSRFVLTAAMTVEDRPMTTLLPYRTASGPVVLGLRSTGTDTFELACARYDGDWRPVGDLRTSSVSGPDPDISFDPVRHQLPGLEQYPSVARLREPAYLRARESRSPG